MPIRGQQHVLTPVASLGTVQGSYTETTTTNGDRSGTETFHSNAGEIDQTSLLVQRATRDSEASGDIRTPAGAVSSLAGSNWQRRRTG